MPDPHCECFIGQIGGTLSSCRDMQRVYVNNASQRARNVYKNRITDAFVYN